MTRPVSDSSLSTLFNSFWLAGFESSCHINRANVRLDMPAATQHDQQVAEDYALLKRVGIRAARDGMAWHRIERTGRFDFSSVAPMVEAAQKQGLQIIWDLCHFGWPDDLDIFAPQFIDRFARYCTEVARFLARYSDGVPFITPINEISFVAWGAGEGDVMYPFARGRAYELKRHLVRAVIAGIEAIWSVTPGARIVIQEPVIHVVPRQSHPDRIDLAEIQDAQRWRSYQFEAWDWLAGHECPELGGDPRYLDIIGLSYYWSHQWEYPGKPLGWADTPFYERREYGDKPIQWADVRWDRRRLPFHQLLIEVYERYQRPLFLGETSHYGAGRGAWVRYITQEVRRARRLGAPVEGICIYPILDRPDWDNARFWHSAGLWELLADASGNLRRVLNEDYASDLQHAQLLLTADDVPQVATLNGAVEHGEAENHGDELELLLGDKTNGSSASSPFLMAYPSSD